MTLGSDGVVAGEIKGQVFSLGEDELIRGERGYEAVSDDDDDDIECFGNCDLWLNASTHSRHLMLNRALPDVVSPLSAVTVPSSGGLLVVRDVERTAISKLMVSILA